MDKDGSEGEPRMDYYSKKPLDVYVNRSDVDAVKINIVAIVIAANKLLFIYSSISSKRTLPPPFFRLVNADSRLSDIISL